MESYNHKDIEKKWQDEWEKQSIYSVPDTLVGKKNFYELVEFTYPSGNLHVGHWYAFSVPDIHARFKRMQGFNVLYPMGFDAFGLPAENAAIKLGADPKVLTYEQMDRMRTQFRSMGAMFDWDREVVSCDSKYYKWTQWMFNQFLKNDLVYRDVTKVNWCPKDQTVLANEQVVDGCCERCGSEVIQKNQEQWMLRITKYADRLIDDLDTLAWPEEIKAAQRNWIGRSEGSEIEFQITNDELRIKVFTTRADTLFGVTYIVLAPEHELIKNLKLRIANWDEVEEYIHQTKKKSELDRQQSKEKTGVQLKGIKAINPANGEEVPVWVADYVLAGYGTGAVMAVPAHDERDFAFAKKYNLSSKEVIEPIFVQKTEPGRVRDELPFVEREAITAIVKHPTTEKYIGLKWKKVAWETFITGGVEEGQTPEEAAIAEIQQETGYKNLKLIKVLPRTHAKFFHVPKNQNRFAHFNVLYFELQNDEKIEITKEENDIHEVIWLDKDEMEKFQLPESHRFSWNSLFQGESIYTTEGILTNSGEFNGLNSNEARIKITEFVGGKMVKTYRLRDWGISRQRYWGTPIPIVYDIDGKAHPVPDEHLPWLLPTDVDHTPDGTAPLARSKELFERTEKLFGKGWRPEVETMDTFIDSSWYFYRYLDNHNNEAFATKEKIEAWMPINLYMGGAEHTTMHLLYSRFWVKAMKDCGLVIENEPYTVRRNRGIILGPDGNKMSKSKGNIINPDEIVERLGADTVRMYLAFMGPYGVTTNYPWDPNGVVGVRRFLERVWRLQFKIDKQKKVCKTDNLVQKTIKGVTEDIEEYKFNTAIAKMMILVNALEKEEAIVENSYKILLRILAPFAPHITEELWHELGEKTSIHLALWPTFDPTVIIDEQVTIVVQINGKVRSELMVQKGIEEETIKNLALADEKIIRALEGKTIQKIIYVKDRLLSIVV
jgi:leucyl-tRNA synthetase